MGGATCKKCHYRVHKGWMEQGHARAFDVLPDAYRDVAARDEHGRACLACHVTAWGQPGGFVDPARSQHLLGVQCEACHGPGSRHVELGRQMLKEKRRELAPGEQSWIVLRTTDCVDCHHPHVEHSEY